MTRAAPGILACPGCGALVPDIDGPTHAYLGASAGCWAAWGAFQARSFASPLILERGRAPADGIRAKQLLLAGARTFSRLEPPVGPYATTVLDVAAITDAAAVPGAVRRWADGTWEAWRAHHAAVRARAVALDAR